MLKKIMFCNDDKSFLELEFLIKGRLEAKNQVGRIRDKVTLNALCKYNICVRTLSMHVILGKCQLGL